MDQLVACPDCGTPNRIDADLCVQCWRGMSDELAQQIPVAAFAVSSAPQAPTAPPPPPTRPRTLREAPARKPSPAPEPAPERELSEPLAPYFASAPVTAQAGAGAVSVPGSVAAPLPSTPRQRRGPGWSAHHLAIVGALAFGLPMWLTPQLVERFEGRGMMDAGLAIQICGYLLGALAIAFFVYRVQGGDWDSIGLRRTPSSVEDVARGFGLGLVLIGSFIGGTYLITQQLGVDGLVRALVGGTTGPGFVLGALVVVVGAPIMEEIYFRGMLFERVGRLLGIAAAVVVTTVLFVLAHRVGLWDPPRLLMGLSLGLARRTKSLWFTIGGHAAWNLVVIGLGVSLLMGPSHTFTAADGSFTLRHPAEWDLMEEMPASAGLDLVLTTPAGAFIGVGRQEMAPGMNRSNLGPLLSQAQASLPLPPGLSMGPIRETNLVRGHLAKTYESAIEISDPVLGSGKARMVAVVRDGSTKLMVAVMACPAAECAAANADFDAMLHSVQFSP